MSLLDNLFFLKMWLNSVLVSDVPRPIEIVGTGVTHSIVNGRSSYDFNGLNVGGIGTDAVFSSVTVGSNAATTGLIRAPNNSAVVTAKKAVFPGGNAALLSFDFADHVVLGSTGSTTNYYNCALSGSHIFQINSTDAYSFSASVADFKSSALRFGTNPANGGTVRLPNAATVAWRAADNSANIVGLQVNSANAVVIGDSAAVNNGVEVQVGSGANLDVKVANSFSYRFSATAADWFDHDIVNVRKIDGATFKTGALGAALTNANQTLTLAGGSVYELPAGTLTANREKTLSTGGAARLDTIVIRRLDVSAFTVDVRNGAGVVIYTFPASTAREVNLQHDGSDWVAVGAINL